MGEPVGNVSFIVWGSDWNSSTPIPAVRVAEGVKPKGSVWMRNPIPWATATCMTPQTITRSKTILCFRISAWTAWGRRGALVRDPHDGSRPCFQASPALWFMLRGIVEQGGEAVQLQYRR